MMMVRIATLLLASCSFASSGCPFLLGELERDLEKLGKPTDHPPMGMLDMMELDAESNLETVDQAFERRATSEDLVKETTASCKTKAGDRVSDTVANAVSTKVQDAVGQSKYGLTSLSAAAQPDLGSVDINAAEPACHKAIFSGFYSMLNYHGHFHEETSMLRAVMSIPHLKIDMWLKRDVDEQKFGSIVSAGVESSGQPHLDSTSDCGKDKKCLQRLSLVRRGKVSNEQAEEGGRIIVEKEADPKIKDALCGRSCTRKLPPHPGISALLVRDERRIPVATESASSCYDGTNACIVRPVTNADLVDLLGDPAFQEATGFNLTRYQEAIAGMTGVYERHPDGNWERNMHLLLYADSLAAVIKMRDVQQLFEAQGRFKTLFHNDRQDFYMNRYIRTGRGVAKALSPEQIMDDSDGLVYLLLFGTLHDRLRNRAFQLDGIYSDALVNSPINIKALKFAGAVMGTVIEDTRLKSEKEFTTTPKEQNDWCYLLWCAISLLGAATKDELATAAANPCSMLHQVEADAWADGNFLRTTGSIYDTMVKDHKYILLKIIDGKVEDHLVENGHWFARMKGRLFSALPRRWKTKFFEKKLGKDNPMVKALEP